MEDSGPPPYEESLAFKKFRERTVRFAKAQDEIFCTFCDTLQSVMENPTMIFGTYGNIYIPYRYDEISPTDDYPRSMSELRGRISEEERFRSKRKPY